MINVVQLLVDSAGGKFKYKTIIVFNENKNILLSLYNI
ncbi:hypothetical protein ECDEC10F_5883 [Escherichia coli DEC10F]|nr:hypothetical protein ECDEC8C_4466 [Escherichia coli DEC8C]EHW28857.1 hypothetical protein ECDEC9A_5362 [Escherichia coli DEC9A]EHW34073.1 hypothetical protein ECDEC9B_4957 [Escherichia coli DEC9B]EHW57336.1 hypothetical protein ECDEC10A_5479 [Escherichia coli DEC10A]EHW67675.1 hypothetical protein ECDEC10C_5784 [Escherichia coli DEC10C]EHW72761.1 hypothetical protein ECDEC10D_5378 [Escherichia coli DEC10D]EHW85419.1 hypothetical protein ECDEC10F_5883 [Escherichia coli DEC10F]EHX16923.1 hy